MQNLLSITDLDAAVARSHERRIVIVKHSVSCGTSAMAMEEVEDFEAGPSALEVFVVSVQLAPRVSAEIGTRFGIRHETPQALILDRGAVVWHGSHFRVSHQHLAAAIEKAFPVTSKP